MPAAITSSPSRRGVAISWDVFGRAGLLFVVLCLIKLAMLAGFRKHLYELHWRLDLSTQHTWLNQAFFFIFALLVAVTIWRLGTRCAAGGLRMVRAANLCVLALGALFIFLSFAPGDKNFLFSLVAGTRSWHDLAAAFISEPPVWSVWILFYALFYHLLVCVGREHLVLRLTAVMAAIYTILFLQDMIDCRDALLVADCLGAVCLLAGAGSQKPLGWFWLVQPWCWLAFLFFVFRPEEIHLHEWPPERVVPVGWCLVLLAGLSVVAWRRKFYSPWSWSLPFVFGAFCLLINLSYEFTRNDLNLLCLGLTLPHYFFGEFLLAGGLLAVALLYRRFLPAASLWWLDVINLLLIALAVADLCLTRIMGVRLDWQVIQFGADFTMVWRMAKTYLPDLIIGLILLTGLYAILVGLLRRTGAHEKTLQLGAGGRFFLIAFLGLGLAGSWLAGNDLADGESAFLLAESCPWFSTTTHPVMADQHFQETARRLGLASMLAPPVMPARPPRDLNVVLIFQESSYNKYLSLFGAKDNTQPLLGKYRDRMELFPGFFSSFAGSVNARFATLSGLYPVRDFQMFTFNRVEVKSLYDVLHDHGYVSSVFASDSFDYTGFRQFLRGRGIEAMYDADTMPGRGDEPPVSWGVREGVTFKAIRAQLKQYAASHQKFFLSYFPVAPHHPYDGIPPEFRKFPVTKKDPYVPQYKNELLYLDWGIASILDELKDSGLLDNTLVVITDDHGEMLGENGGPIGHGWAVLPELANIPLIIMDPANPGYHVNDTIGSQVDLLPTILDLLGIPAPAGQFYQGASLYSATARDERRIYLNSFQQYGVVEGRRFVRASRTTENLTVTNNPSLRAFWMTNDGPREVFTETNTAGFPAPYITPFDKFQENFLLNYSHYQQANQPAAGKE
ncbi:MAG: LTA synthase family protein [Verrucomicrobiae bacterium]|nr:LTA synthase family protein [Verrucomicrobiae bacterium]